MKISCYFSGGSGATHAAAAEIAAAYPSALFYNVSPDRPIAGVPQAVEGRPDRPYRAIPLVLIDTDDGTQEHSRLEERSATKAELDAEVAAVNGGLRPARTKTADGPNAEPVFLSPGGLVSLENLPVGTVSGTLCAGDDARLADARPPLAHVHDASAIVSGQLAIARIASGTPDGTKFVADDGTLKTPPVGGTGATKVRQLAAQTAINGTLVNVLNLAFALVAGTTYRFRFAVVFRSTSGTVGLKLGLTFPAATIFAASARIPIAATGTAGELQGSITASGGSVTGTAVPAANADYLARVDGVIVPSSSGTLQLQFAAETTGATVTLQAGSVGSLEAY
jgi:hypothetical protein